ncbi:hypothetical protein C8F04DRAFT_1194950 [Mycena alexandri]|uniref:Uncharacterized protein n=1 Tax=Mycena alexandri TaxID=1745969 RepID=A0AAD6WPA5_9AGAR|nr:hypothetical protein C8F04DRAFT_1194950 [Mycena alexandri]
MHSQERDRQKKDIIPALYNSAGDTHPGCVYIHISHQTHLAIINVADNFVADALEVTEEVTEFTDKAAALEAGSLVVNFVTALRIDQPITEPSAATHIWKRIYKVRASHVVQLYHTPC